MKWKYDKLAKYDELFLWEIYVIEIVAQNLVDDMILLEIWPLESLIDCWCLRNRYKSKEKGEVFRYGKSSSRKQYKAIYTLFNGKNSCS